MLRRWIAAFLALVLVLAMRLAKFWIARETGYDAISDIVTFVVAVVALFCFAYTRLRKPRRKPKTE